MMHIELKHVKIRDLFHGFEDKGEEGVVGYDGKLNIRPPYQREFVYDEKRQKAVVESILNGFPLGVMYWMENNDGTYEILDGQQRTISICNYLEGSFSVAQGKHPHRFEGLPTSDKEKILNYDLWIFFCKGDDHDKIDWFEIINTGGIDLNEQEKLNAAYTGPWLTDAKRYFSRAKDNDAAAVGKDYIKGDPKKQELLAKALKWIADRNKISVREYMDVNQKKPNALELREYYEDVFKWVRNRFDVRPKTKEVEWGLLYNYYNAHKEKLDKKLDPTKIEEETSRLMHDKDVTDKAGIYYYIVTGDEARLSIRAFEEEDMLTKYEEQKGICPICKKHFEYKEMEGDHIIAWHDGGKTVYENLQMLCQHCNRVKSGK